MIKLVHRFRPFCHLPGMRVLLPGAPFVLQPFPTLLRLTTVAGDLLAEARFGEVGPLTQFTIMQDLERGLVRVSGMAKSGFFHYEVVAMKEGAILRKKSSSVEVTGRGLSVGDAVPLYATPRERLSFGCYKQQDWELMLRRRDLHELLPLWFWLAQSMPSAPAQSEQGTLVGDLQEAIQKKERLALVPLLLDIFLAGFSGMWVPQSVDTNHLGYPKPVSRAELFPATLPLIRSLFFREEGECWHIMPLLPPQFHCGKLVHISAANATLSLEWTKKCVRRVVIETDRECVQTLRFPREIVSFRLRDLAAGTLGRFPNNSSLSLKAHSRYVCDQFET